MLAKDTPIRLQESAAQTPPTPVGNETCIAETGRRKTVSQRLVGLLRLEKRPAELEMLRQSVFVDKMVATLAALPPGVVRPAPVRIPSPLEGALRQSLCLFVFRLKTRHRLVRLKAAEPVVGAASLPTAHNEAVSAVARLGVAFARRPALIVGRLADVGQILRANALAGGVVPRVGLRRRADVVVCPSARPVQLVLTSSRPAVETVVPVVAAAVRHGLDTAAPVAAPLSRLTLPRLAARLLLDM